MRAGETRFFGKPVRRNEDPRLLTGQALFVDDIDLPGMLQVAFYRSPYAHARIEQIDVTKAREVPGVVAVYTAQDLGEYWRPGPLLVPPPPVQRMPIFHKRTQVPLARDKVRYVGEPVVLVVAENRYIAEDAVEQVLVDFTPLDPVIDLERALAPDAALVHEDCGTNIAAHVIQEKGDWEEAIRAADLVLEHRFVYDHGHSAAMETRGIVAHWDSRMRYLTVWDSTQAPIPIRNGLAGMLGLSENQVRVIAPFIGGGFGPKVMMFYPEEVLIPWVSMQLHRPVKWIEDRQENFMAQTHERSQIHDAKIALTREGRILGVWDSFLHDTGAYIPYGLTVPLNSQCTLLGPYKIPHYYSEFKAIFTNKSIVTPYRGAGRQHGVFVMERLLDLAARTLNMDRTVIRRQNFIPSEEFPYDNQIIYQDFAPLVYDNIPAEAILDKAMEMIDYQRFVQEEQPRLRAEGRQVGIGLVCYVEGTGIGPYEGARVHVQHNGKILVATGVGTQGQGHFTSFAQVVAEQLGVDPQDVTVITGDTAEFHWGTGTFASRSAVVAGSAIHEAARAVREKILRMVSDEWEIDPVDLELVDGMVRVKGMPERAISLGELAVKANPLRGAVAPHTEPGLEATRYFGPPRGTTASGAHALIVEVDPETAMVRILKYVVVHDCGKVINPLIVRGQIQGGVAQGLGNAFYEKIVYDEQGQLLTASFMDYLVPTAMEVPSIEIGHVESLAPWNPLGAKGVGEGGAIPVAPAFVQAIEDACHQAFFVDEIPLSPSRLWELISTSLHHRDTEG
ncbi:MAG: xanthine dehydrogenase family protein molybdopterin-binding subunit [Nitrospinota bacterium]|nr:MAG: xanthine dehydrogenase family protein molybdopterin-binding subunit [Nitrospinota bacterium]